MYATCRMITSALLVQYTRATQRAAYKAAVVLDDIGYYHLFVLQYFDVKSRTLT